MKKIGIIIPAYNSEKFISYCLGSILNQSVKDAQVIVVDDCSTDNTLILLNSYRPKFEELGFEYNIISLKKNSGQAACFNYAFKILNSELFMWLDSDDFLYSNCFEEKIKYMDLNSDINLCICSGDLYNWPNLENKIGKVSVKNTDCDYFKNVLERNDVIWAPGSICVRTKFLFSRIENRSIFSSREGQNIQLLLPILYNAKYRFINISLYGVVAHQDSHSRIKRTFKQFTKREKDLLLIYKKTIKIIDATKKEKNKFLKIAKRGIYLSIFKICVSEKEMFRTIYYFFYLDKVDKKLFLNKIMKKVFKNG